MNRSPGRTAGADCHQGTDRPTGSTATSENTRQETMRSSSSGQKVSARTRLSESVTLFKKALNRRSRPAEELFAKFDQNVQEYEALFKKYTGRDIRSAKIVEIGFGARPYRLATFHAKQLDVTGIDMDKPVLDGSLKEFLCVARNNGLERALKSVTRHYVADRIEQEKFKKFHRTGDFLDRSKLVIGNASSAEIWESLGQVDLVTSEDVVEHIPVEQLEKLTALIAEHLTDDGLALICPNIFTGITGGHLLEWYHDVVDLPGKTTEPWEHLRQDRVEVNTYLNRLTRADFRALFSSHFEILEEVVREPDLGRQWFTDEVKEALSDWSEEELFSNQVIFVLRKPQSRNGGAQ
jgi:hypothetical protein